MNVLARRPWPVAALLLFALLAADLESARGLSFAGQQWAVPGAVLLIGLALAAPARPRLAALAAAGAVVLSSVLIHAVDAITIAVTPLLNSETAALMAIIAVVVQRLRTRLAAALIAAQLAAGLVAHQLRPQPRTDMSVREVLVTNLLLLVLAIAAGRYLRGRDRERRRATEEAVEAARQRERTGLARELHDVVAHHIGGMVVQAQAAQAVAAADPGAAARALPVIERAGTDALASMRRMVATLRDGGESGHPAPEDLTTALRALTGTPGTPVTVTTDLAEPVPPALTTSVLRLVQESVTNARRHAIGAQGVAVTVTSADGQISIRVRDDGRPGGPPRTYGGGYGLVGMRERVDLLGGRFEAGRTGDGGWQVAADLPLSNRAG